MRRLLTLGAAALSSMIVLAFVIPLGLLVRTLAQDRALVNAERRAQVLVPVLATFESPAQLDQVIKGLDNNDGSSITIFLGDGTVVGAIRRVDSDVELARHGKAFTTDAPGGLQLLLPVIVGQETEVIRIFVPEDQLLVGVYNAWAVLAILGVGLVGVATLVADRAAKALVAPIDALADTAERLSHGELDARVEVAGPHEVREVGITVNRLASRIGELLTAERENVADLSHRLRTPVTALRLDVDALAPGEKKDRLVADVDALARAVDRLITEARRPVREGVGAQADLAGVTRERVAFWSVLADEQGRRYETAVPDDPCLVAVTPDDLDAALDAMLGNIFAHTDEGVGFRVTVEATDDGARLVLEDDGKGWPDDDDVLVRGMSGGGSTGLGLDIVRRTAEASGGSVTLDASASGGARFTADFGAPTE